MFHSVQLQLDKFSKGYFKFCTKSRLCRKNTSDCYICIVDLHEMSMLHNVYDVVKEL